MIARQRQFREPVRAQRFLLSRGLTTRRSNVQIAEAPSSQIPLVATPTVTCGKPTQIQNKASNLSQADLGEALLNVRTACSTLQSPERVPSEKEVLIALSQCNALAEALELDLTPSAPVTSSGAASALLSLDEAPAKQSLSTKPTEIGRAHV